MSVNPYQAVLDQLAAKIAETESLVADPELGELAQLELADLKNQQAQLEQASAEYGSERETNNGQIQFMNCILEIRQGAGGDEAKIWANDLLRMYIRFFEQIGLKFEYIDDSVIKVKGKITNSELIARFR
jgi:peptide chain release factor 1